MAGKAVICEKPFAINAREAGLMIEKAREKRLFLMEAMWTRYIPAVVRLRELLAENAIGRVQLMIAGGGVDEHDAILLQHDSEAMASLYVSLRAKASPDMTLLGDGGKIYLHAPIFVPPALTISIPGKADEVLQLPFEGNGYQFQAIEAANCIMAGQTESTIMPLDESLAIMQTMDEIRRQLGLKYPMEK